MKMGVWSALCCLFLAMCFLDVSDTVCTDSHLLCSRDIICDQPGVKNMCKKTCGLCDDEPGQTTCPNGTWGRGCTERCSVGCVDGVCYKESGGCYKCKPCYEGPQCTDVSYSCTCTSKGTCECKDGWYGERCEGNCNGGCLNKTCNSNGTCRLGCDPGRYGDRCDISCFEHCLNGTCNRSGRCTLGCGTGWFGTSCEQRCPENCGSDTCGRLDGSCTSCHDGYTGSHCNISCPVNCEGKTCYQNDGTCPACDDGWFGHHCNISCPENCEAKTCNQTDGVVSAPVDVSTAWCSRGCEAGWFGRDCSSPCPPGCENCEREDGRCLKSRVSGLVVWVVLPVIVITLLLIASVVLVARLMRNKSLKKHTNQMPGFYQGSPKGALSQQGDEMQLLASRDHRPLPPLPGGHSPDTMSSEPMVEAEEPESYIFIRHL